MKVYNYKRGKPDKDWKPKFFDKPKESYYKIEDNGHSIECYNEDGDIEYLENHFGTYQVFENGHAVAGEYEKDFIVRLDGRDIELENLARILKEELGNFIVEITFE